MEKEIIKQFAAHLDEQIKLKGIWEMLDGVILQKGLELGYEKLQKEAPAVAKELLDLIEAYLQYDKLGMVDEAADLLASIVKVVFYGKSVRRSE